MERKLGSMGNKRDRVFVKVLQGRHENRGRGMEEILRGNGREEKQGLGKEEKENEKT